MSKKIAILVSVLLLVVLTACGTTATPLPQATAEPTIAPIPTIEALATQTSPTGTPTLEPSAATSSDAADINLVFIQLTDPLDEPQFYCLDVPGSGTAVRLHVALQVHTCKLIETAEDELFALDYPGPGQVIMEAYDLCLEADGTRAGSLIFLRPCSDSPKQIFKVDSDIIRIGDGIQGGLCVAADPAPDIATGGPSHLRRDVALQPCNPLDPAIPRWIFGLFDY